jgi:hypothetical protein
VQHAASAITAPDTEQPSAYWQFHAAVARAQLTQWLPAGRHLLVDVSGPRGPGARLAARAGHTVLRVLDAQWGQRGLGQRGLGQGGLGQGGLGQGGLGGRGAPPSSGGSGGVAPQGQQGRIVPLIAESSRLTFLADGCADGVIADDRALSVHLAAEAMIAEIARVLRPAGRVIACVDSLVLGMAVLADQHHWAELVDLPHADVVLVPWPDGTITRCFGPDQARELFSGGGLQVNWIRPRTVLSESVVTHWLRRDPGGLAKLVRAELSARTDESLGAQLVISASKPRWPVPLAVPLGPLGLAADAAGGVGPGVEPALGNLVTAVHALPVGVFVQPAQRGQHLAALALRGLQDGLGPVGLGKDGPGVRRVLRIPRARRGPGALTLQDGDRPVQVVAHLL